MVKARLPLSPLQLLYRARDRFSDRTAVVDGEQRFTYPEFVDRCERLAAELRRLGVGPGEVAAFQSFNTHQMLEAYFAPALLGAVCLPIHARLAEAEVDAIARNVRLKVFWREPFPVFKQRERADWVVVDERETAALFYTSGTMDQPKAVRLSHRNLYMHALALSATAGRRRDDVELQVIPLFHANGWGRPHMSILQGNKIVLLRRFDAREFLRLVEREGVTNTALVPTMARDLLMEAGQFGRSSLREIHLGGSLPAADLVDDLERAFECRVTVGYGMTEANSAIAYDGVPLPGLEVRLHESGEIWLRGETVACEGWLATGDLGRWTPEGRLEVTGRKKDIVISGGENISVREVEQAIEAHPDVVEAAVIGIPDERWGEATVAFVVTKASLSEPGLSLFLEGRLARYKIPQNVIFRTELLPRNGAGKIAKRVLGEEHRAAAPGRETETVEKDHVDIDFA